ncbi:GNAT family N-acetyltransferase [Azoarcus sp. L1K30]|uniref:GNAT family N-acetyltransferase n=1 Tax=Azoarcus sp. L1K30 TaxID=2820277 RepID=UPI001B83E0D2|nr:GNAT family N-acetyltransferase [Azoarcus sp. L1K30]MBR0565764.1 GNAT family N-acetyltransferase [Azoarcus sp. L1K30]
MTDINVLILDWDAAAARAMPLRERVFVVEQGVPAEMELDEFDPVSCHALALDAGQAVVATGRLLPDGHIGRMAVDAAWRGRGVGGRVLEALVSAAWARGMDEVLLNAQVDAIAFYLRHGFMAEGEFFMEAGIRHRAMRRSRSGA